MFSTLVISLLLMLQPPQGGYRNPNAPRTDGKPPSGNQQPITGTNVLIDGVYTILAYEKFGQVLPGMANAKVVIRNNILTFPGDTKTPGKMLQLRFGPNNSITITPLDGRTPPVIVNNQTAADTNQSGANTAGTDSAANSARHATGTPPVNNNQSSAKTNDPAKIAQGGADAATNAARQASGTPPVNNNQTNNTGTGVMQTGKNTPAQELPPGTESGVYVLSIEYFSISVISQAVVVPSGQININQNPPGNEKSHPFRAPIPPQQPGGGSTFPNQAVLVLKRVAN